MVRPPPRRNPAQGLSTAPRNHAELLWPLTGSPCFCGISLVLRRPAVLLWWREVSSRDDAVVAMMPMGTVEPFEDATALLADAANLRARAARESAVAKEG